MTFRKTPIAAAVAAALCFKPTASVVAQELAAIALEEIVVTSTRRSTSVQETPISITAIGGSSAEDLGLEGLDELQALVPGLNLVDSGPWGNSTIIIRGLNADSITGTGNETDGGNTVGIYMGETPLYADFKLLDINRVEALMGPQGTLYGAGTLAGAIRYVPNRPNLTTFSANAHTRMYSLAHGNGVGHQEDAMLNLPLIDGKLALRAVAAYYDDPGFIDYSRIVRSPGRSDPQPDMSNPAISAANLAPQEDLNYEETFSSRLSLLWAPMDKLDALVTFMHQDTDTGGRQIQTQDAIGTGRYEAGLRYAEPSERDADLISLELTGDLGFAQVVTSSSYSEQTINTIRDQTDLLLYLSDTGGYGYEDFPQFVAYTTGDTDRAQHTEELRLVSKGDSKLSWIVGGFYNRLNAVTEGIEYTPGLPAFFGIDRPDEMEYFSNTDRVTKEKAGYGELGYTFTDAWQVTVGGRYYEYEESQINLTDLPLLNSGPYVFSFQRREGSISDDGSLFKVNTSYKFSADFMAYATVSEGYRLGGFNAVTPCNLPLTPGQNVCALPDERQFLPDKTLNKEIGVHTQWLDRKLTVNASIYHIDWDDVQVAGITQNGAIGITTNGAKAVSQGAELLMIGALPRGFTVTANYTYTDAQLTQDVKGLVDDRFTLERDPDSPNYIPACDPDSAAYTGLPIGSCPGDALDGDRLPGSPKHKGSVYLGWMTPFANDTVLRVNYGISAQGNVFTKVGNRASGEALGGYAIHNMSVGLEKNNWSLSFFGENIFDKYAYTAVTNDASFVYTALGSASAGTAFDVRRYNRTLIRPASFGLEFRMKFGGT